MKIKTLIISLFIFSAQFVTAQDTAKEIFLKATEALTTDNIEMVMAIDVTDDKGRLKAKELTVLMATFGEEEKTKVIWQKPERAKGTTIIITELPGETGTIEVFTPSNGKTRKLKATDANMKMMGTGFNMTSFANYNPEELIYKMLSDTTVNNISCYQIEVSGAATKDNSSAVLVIVKDSNFIVQATRFNEKNEAISQTQLSDYKKMNGEPTKMYPMRIVTADYENNKDIFIRIINVGAKKDLTKSAFTL